VLTGESDDEEPSLPEPPSELGPGGPPSAEPPTTCPPHANARGRPSETSTLAVAGFIEPERSTLDLLSKDRMTVRIVRLGTPRARGEGLRIGTVRRPPRGVPASRFASDDWYDVWYPDLSPSADAVKVGLGAQTDQEWARFARMYRSEMSKPTPSRTLDLLAALSHTADFSVGCYCKGEARCHRSLLRELLAARGAKMH
jgi:uncharacterized protein YeaO (DUF488 family)